MNPLSNIILANLFLILIWITYELLLSRTKIFQANRFFLLGGSALAVILPWLPWQVHFNIPHETFMGISMVPVDPQSIDPSLLSGPVAHSPVPNPANWPMIIYFSITIFLFLVSAGQFVRLLIWTKTRPEVNWNGHRVILLNRTWSAFSFFRTIYYPEPYEPEKHETRTILEHETVHVRQLHSVDNTFLLIIRILFFYNPASYLIAGRLRLTHEYIADEATAGSDKAKYSHTLISHQFMVPRLILMQSFNTKSFLKRRLIMLTKNKQHRLAGWKYLLLIPLIGGMVLLSGWSASAQDQDTKKTKQTGVEKQAYTYVDEMPTFQGGKIEDFRNWVQANVKYPAEAKEKKISGTVYMSFVVDTTGRVIDSKTIRSASPLFDAEVLKVFNSAPLWKPGKQRGKPVNVALSMPIKFVFSDSKKNQTYQKIEPSAPTIQGVKTGESNSANKNGNTVYVDGERVQDTSKKVFEIVEEMPTFQGGTIVDFRNWIQVNVKYPAEALKKKISGTVYATFVVNKEGKIVDIDIVRSVDPILDKEVIRALKDAPAWKPGKQKGEFVNVSLSIPVRFVQTGSKAKEEDVTIIALGNGEDRNDEVFIAAEEMPQFQNGGIKEFTQWVQSVVKYPAKAMEESISGTVEIAFIVNRDGAVENIKVHKSASKVLDDAAVAAVKSSPAWTPGKQSGKTVRVGYTIPVVFKRQ